MKKSKGTSEVLGVLLFPDERTAVVGFDPEGITAIRRGLSEATPPVGIIEKGFAS